MEDSLGNRLAKMNNTIVPIMEKLAGELTRETVFPFEVTSATAYTGSLPAPFRQHHDDIPFALVLLQTKDKNADLKEINDVLYYAGLDGFTVVSDVASYDVVPKDKDKLVQTVIDKVDPKLPALAWSGPLFRNYSWFGGQNRCAESLSFDIKGYNSAYIQASREREILKAAKKQYGNTKEDLPFNVCTPLMRVIKEGWVDTFQKLVMIGAVSSRDGKQSIDFLEKEKQMHPDNSSYKEMLKFYDKKVSAEAKIANKRNRRETGFAQQKIKNIENLANARTINRITGFFKRLREGL